jgi:peptide deformylase
MMTEPLEIALLGNSILRQQAQPVANVADPDLQRLIDCLIATAVSKDGVGIAAPQVSRSDRLLIVASRPNARYPHAPAMKPTAAIDPRILAHSDRVVKDWEGCLSVPRIRGLVPRYEWIEVEYLDRQGNLQRHELTGFVARIFQHELDHLDGILFIDRVESTRDLYSEQEYQRLQADSQNL